MILCFSGTGNSMRAARRIAAVAEDDVVSVNALIKRGEKAVFDSDKPYVFVCPTYAWRIPRIFERFIREAALNGSRRAYFVMSCGGDAGNSARYMACICRCPAGAIEYKKNSQGKPRYVCPEID